MRYFVVLSILLFAGPVVANDSDIVFFRRIMSADFAANFEESTSTTETTQVAVSVAEKAGSVDDFSSDAGGGKED